jgi:RNA polymerase sigma factor (sigma-70 family)
VSSDPAVEDLLRVLAPPVLGALARRYGDFAHAEDAVQEALVAAASTWPAEGVPANPRAWLVWVASRRLTDQYRADEARRRREELAASWALAEPTGNPGTPELVSGQDDTLILMFLCCHPALTPGAAIPLTLRAVGGLTTREIANAFLVPEATMGQRISRAKARIQASGEPFALPAEDDRPGRLRQVEHILYLLFNEGYLTSEGGELARADLSGEAIRLTRLLHAAVPNAPEVTGLLALMLLTEARRPARTGPEGELVPLAEQDRSRWNRPLVEEGSALMAEARSAERVGEYQLQAAIAAAHDRAPSHAATDWAEIASLYALLEQLTGNPMVRLNRAVATAMDKGPTAGLTLLAGLETRLGNHHRLHAVRAHLLEQSGNPAGAAAEFAAAAAGATNARERDYLTTQAARLSG